MLFYRFDTFGNHPKVKLQRQGNNALADSGVLVALGSILHEAAVDLDLVDGQVAQVTQAGKTGAEVVDGGTDPHAA